MSALKHRIRTLRAILNGSCVQRSARYSSIHTELEAIEHATQLSARSRRLLLQVVHSTRCLDSILAAFLQQENISTTSRSLGGYLKTLQTHSRPHRRQLAEASRRRYQRSIVDPRNRFMHEANAYPAGDRELHDLLVEMHACITEILAL